MKTQKEKVACKDCKYSSTEQYGPRKWNILETYCNHSKNIEEIYNPKTGESTQKYIDIDVMYKWNKDGYCKYYLKKEIKNIPNMKKNSILKKFCIELNKILENYIEKNN